MPETKFKTLRILLRTNIKDHETIMYEPRMTIPTTKSSILYVTPTIPIDMADINRLDPKFSAYLSNKLANQRSVSDSDLRYADLESDNKIDIFLNPKALLDVVTKKIERGNRTGNPVAPKQFKNASDLLNGQLVKLNGRIAFRKGNKFMELHDTYPHALEFGHSFVVGHVLPSSSFKPGGTITVSNEFPQGDPQHRSLRFVNSVRPLSLQQAHEKGYVNDNVRFIVGLLFASDRKFYYNGNPLYGFPIHSFNIEQQPQDKLWQVSSSDPHTLIVTVSLMLLPIVPMSVRPNQITSNDRAMNCIFRKEQIRNNFSALFGGPGTRLSADALVELPRNVRTDSHSGQGRISSQNRRIHTGHPAFGSHGSVPPRPGTYGGARSRRRGKRRRVRGTTLRARRG